MCVEYERNAYKILVVTPEGKKETLGSPNCRSMDNIKMGLIEL